MVGDALTSADLGRRPVERSGASRSCAENGLERPGVREQAGRRSLAEKDLVR